METDEPNELMTPASPPPLSAEIENNYNDWEQSLAKVTMLHFAQGGLWMAFGIAILGSAAMEKDVAFSIVGSVIAGTGILWLKVARGLSHRHASARWVVICLSAIGLLAFPLGTLLNGLALRVLLKTKHLFHGS